MDRAVQGDQAETLPAGDVPAVGQGSGSAPRPPGPQVGERRPIGAGDGVPPAGVGGATFRGVLAVAEFRAIWVALLLSVAGDQLARVAMTVLVYERTRSALLAALTYAVTFLPWIVGAVGLSGLADRLPRREVMIVCDLARLALIGVMVAVSFTGALWAMIALLFAVTLLDSPFKSARSALIADILTGEHYVLGTATTQITLQIATVAGFAFGGAVVAGVGTRAALTTDAVTFGLSALLLAAGVRRRPAGALRGRPSPGAELMAGIRLVFGTGTLRTLVLFGWLGALYEVSLGLAVPYSAQFHGAPTAVIAGLVFAATPFGTAIGAAIFGRVVSPSQRSRWMGPMAIGACALPVLCWLPLNLPAALIVFAVSGACGGYQLAANAAFVAAVPAHRRGQAFGLANGGMQVTQGAWFIAAGAIAEALTPREAIALSGALGALLATWLTYAWHARSAQQR